jgi:hypothetical protein
MPLPVPPAMLWHSVKPSRLSQYSASRSVNTDTQQQQQQHKQYGQEQQCQLSAGLWLPVSEATISISCPRPRLAAADGASRCALSAPARKAITAGRVQTAAASAAAVWLRGSQHCLGTPALAAVLHTINCQPCSPIMSSSVTCSVSWCWLIAHLSCPAASPAPAPPV